MPCFLLVYFLEGRGPWLLRLVPNVDLLGQVGRSAVTTGPWDKPLTLPPLRRTAGWSFTRMSTLTGGSAVTAWWQDLARSHLGLFKVILNFLENNACFSFIH